MKRIGNLYTKICDMKNVELAHERGRRRKTWQDSIKRVDKNREMYLKQVQEMLFYSAYKTSPYKIKYVYEPKPRKIYVLPYYPDRIVHHAGMNILTPIWDSYFIEDSYACRVGKGQHKASSRCMQFVMRNKYCLQCDISKFFPSIDHAMIMDLIEHKIKCQRTLDYMNEIITSIGGEKNVPIGNHPSSWLGNLCMNEVDQWLKHTYHVRDYIRYCDDFLLFSNDKEFLNSLIPEIIGFTGERIKLRLSKCTLYHTSQGVDFLGYRHSPSGKILLRKSTAKRIKGKIKALPWMLDHGKINKEGALSMVASFKGWMKWANTHNLSLSLEMNKLEELISNHA